MSLKQENMDHPIGDGDSQVHLSVRLGDGQHVSHQVLAKGDGQYHFGPFSGYPMGAGNSLKGTSSILTVTVTDTNPQTNNTSITVTLDNNDASEVYSQASDSDNGTVVYIITIKHS